MQAVRRKSASPTQPDAGCHLRLLPASPPHPHIHTNIILVAASWYGGGVLAWQFPHPHFSSFVSHWLILTCSSSYLSLTSPGFSEWEHWNYRLDRLNGKLVEAVRSWWRGLPIPVLAS